MPHTVTVFFFFLIQLKLYSSRQKYTWIVCAEASVHSPQTALWFDITGFYYPEGTVVKMFKMTQALAAAALAVSF